MQALLARPFLSGLGRTAIDTGRLDYRDGSRTMPAVVDLPGVLQCGGPRAAAALCAPAPLWLSGAGIGIDFDRNETAPDLGWVGRAYRASGAAKAVRVDRSLVWPGDLAKWLDEGE